MNGAAFLLATPVHRAPLQDGQMLYYEVGTGARITRTASLRDVEWAQWTGILGWQVTGIWDPEYDQTDVNGTCTSHEGGHTVLGDDYGMVKLFRWHGHMLGMHRCCLGHLVPLREGVRRSVPE